MSNKRKNQTNKRNKKKAVLAKKRQQNRKLKLGIWEQLLERKIKDVEFPGGRTRKSFRLHLIDGRSVIATERNEKSRVAMECAVLRHIGRTSTKVPKLLATDGHYLLAQEDLKGPRLSQSLNEANEDQIEILLDIALKNLADIHKEGSELGFDQQFQEIGITHDWITGLLDRPAVIGEHFNIPPPRPKLKELTELFSVSTPRFIKWDARPGNAIVLENNDVAWFDWEHCGTRNRLDDLVWLLCDDFVPDCPEIENRLVENNLLLFSDHFTQDEARKYLYSFGVFHSCVRLGLILSAKGSGSWWDLEYCLSRDKAGITKHLAQQICKRASRWAKQSELTEMLSPWFVEIAQSLE